MDNLQVLHNKAAKFVLNLPNKESSIKALTHLIWRPLSDKRSTDALLSLIKERILSTSLTYTVQGQVQHQKQTEVSCFDQSGQTSILVSFYKRV